MIRRVEPIVRFIDANRQRFRLKRNHNSAPQVWCLPRSACAVLWKTLIQYRRGSPGRDCCIICIDLRRDGRVAEGARLESVFRGNSNLGSNPSLSARFLPDLSVLVSFRSHFRLKLLIIKNIIHTRPCPSTPILVGLGVSAGVRSKTPSGMAGGLPRTAADGCSRPTEGTRDPKRQAPAEALPAQRRRRPVSGRHVHGGKLWRWSYEFNGKVRRP